MFDSRNPWLEVAEFPKNATCAVTSSWDDNDNANIGIMELLDSMRLKGTFYIDPGTPRGNGLTDSQLQALAANHEVGSHTWSHIDMSESDPKAIRDELMRSKEHIETVTGKRVFGLAYPWGKHTPQAEKMVQQCGYIFARTIDEGQSGFPPKNPFAWGISVHAMARPRLLSRKSPLYIRNMTDDWRKLAIRFFGRARSVRGVWHIFGHSWELPEQPGLKDDFLAVCRHVAGRGDVWYATNGSLFLNEIVRKNVHIAHHRSDERSIFRIQLEPSLGNLTRRTPAPLRLVIPRGWTEDFEVEVTTTGSGRFEMGRHSSETWIDLFDNAAKVEVSRR